MASSRNRVMRARLARALRLAPTLLAVCPAALAAQTIDTILVVRHNVYDRKRDAPKVVASVGNALHITTLGWVVRHALLIKRGDTYDSAKVAESERALREDHRPSQRERGIQQHRFARSPHRARRAIQGYFGRRQRVVVPRRALLRDRRAPVPRDERRRGEGARAAVS